jgi:SH3-like domain-containing protein
VKASPERAGKDLFILHEGTKVEVLDTFGEWSEIRIADGNEGWIRSSSIEII